MNPVFSFLFILAVIAAPLPFGGNIPTAWMTSAFIAGVFVIALSIKNIVFRQPPAVPIGWIAIPASLFALVCLWALIQSLRFTPDALHNPLWSASADALGEKLRGAISANPFETQVTLTRLLTYGATFWLALQLARDTRQAELMMIALAFGFLAYALYALVLWSIPSNTILWYKKEVDGVSSTFVNRNSFATFAGIGSVLFLGLFGRKLRHLLYHEEDERFKYRFERFISGLAGPTGFYLVGFLATLGAVFLTQSRGGFFSTLAALTVLMTLLLRRVHTSNKLQSSANAGLLMVAVFALGAILATFYMSGEHITQRIASSELTDAGRKAVYPRIVEAIKDYPLLGTGYGTFQDIFPLYRDETVSAFGRWDKGHNTYLEVMMELGIPAALMLFIAVGLLAWRCLAGGLKRYRNSYIPFTAFAASVLVGLHATADFSLQIPGLTITFAALLGIGVAQSWSSQQH